MNDMIHLKKWTKKMYIVSRKYSGCFGGEFELDRKMAKLPSFCWHDAIGAMRSPPVQ